MEIRANYILVGIFSILVLFGILGTIYWLDKNRSDMEEAFYDIDFKESVHGLSAGNPVLFSGIRVGKVKGIAISRTDPGSVRVRVVIDATTPVREDSEANLELMGLTGGYLVSISGGTAASPLIENSEDGPIPYIHARQSSLGAVIQEAPNTLVLVNSVLENLSQIVSDENKKSVTTILESVAKITSSLASQSESIEGIVSETHITLKELNKAMKAAANASEALNRMVSGVSPEIKRFGEEGLPQLQLFMTEGRNLVHSLSRLTQLMENDPKRFFFGTQVETFSPQQ